MCTLLFQLPCLISFGSRGEVQLSHIGTRVYTHEHAPLPIALCALVAKNDSLSLTVTLKVHSLVQTLETSPHKDIPTLSGSCHTAGRVRKGYSALGLHLSRCTQQTLDLLATQGSNLATRTSLRSSGRGWGPHLSGKR